MAALLSWCLLLASAAVSLAEPDFYSAWCPCKPQYECPNYYGRFFDDILIFGQVPPCKKFDFVRCCSANNIPEGFDLSRPVEYLPQRVREPQPVRTAVPVVPSRRRTRVRPAAEVAQEVAQEVSGAPAVSEGRRGARPRVRVSAAPVAPAAPAAAAAAAPKAFAPAPAAAESAPALLARALDLNVIAQRQDVRDFKAAQEKLKRDIANGIDNPNPPCGCYSEGTCPGRYATKSTGRDIGCLRGFETCCFLDDPWPNYQVTNLTINAPCSIEEACSRFFGTTPLDIASFGPLEPCYLGQNRCLDYLIDASNPPPARVRPTTRRPVTLRPFTTRRPTTTRRPVTTRRPITTRRPVTTRPPVSSPPRTTFRPRTTTFRPRPTTYRPPPQPTPAPSRTTTSVLPEPQPQPQGTDNLIDYVTSGSYLPPSRDFGSAAARAEPAGLQLALPF